MTFEEIYTQYSPKIFRVCMGYVNDHEHARDLTQETFIAVWQNLSTFRNESAIGTWIYRIATNNCLRAVERSKRISFGKFPKDVAMDTEESSDTKVKFLYQCISEMEETDRIIISLVLEDLPQAEIASIVGLSEGNARVKIHRIKQKLTEKFKQYGME